jgi:hypothetical protein
MSESVWALIGATIGSIGLKLIEFLVRGRIHRLDDASQIRAELRSEIKTMRLEINTLRAEVDAWRVKYYQLLFEHGELNLKYIGVQRELVEIRSGKIDKT